jgi:hypothetical protein
MFRLEAVAVGGYFTERWQDSGVVTYRVQAFINERLIWQSEVDHKRSQGWWVLAVHIAYAAGTGKGKFYD